MRNNQPVTQRERPFPKGITLMSTTNPQSHITYANAAFTLISGFTNEELPVSYTHLDVYKRQP